MVDGRQGRCEVVVFIEDGRHNGEQAQTHHAQQNDFSCSFELRFDEEWDRDGEHDGIG